MFTRYFPAVMLPSKYRFFHHHLFVRQISQLPAAHSALLKKLQTQSKEKGAAHRTTGSGILSGQKHSIVSIQGQGWKKTLVKSSQPLQSVLLRLNVPPDLII